MCLDIGENNIIPNVSGRLILDRQVEYEKDAYLSGFNTCVLSSLGCVLLRDVPSVTVFLLNF